MIKKDNEKFNIKTIEQAEQYYRYQKYEVERQQKIQELCLKDFISKVKDFTTIYDVMENTFTKSIEEIKDRQHKKKNHLEILTERLREDFLDNRDIKITKILICGYDKYSYRVEFEVQNKECYLLIPIKKQITVNNFSSANKGRFSFGVKTSEYSSSILKSTYGIEELSTFVDQYLLEEGDKE